MTPGSIVRVLPLGMPTEPVRVYGLFAWVHLVSVLIIPPKKVEACVVPKKTEPAAVPQSIRVIRRTLNALFKLTP